MGNPKFPLGRASLIPRRYRSLVSPEFSSRQLIDSELLRSKDMADPTIDAEPSTEKPLSSGHSASTNSLETDFAIRASAVVRNESSESALEDPLPEKATSGSQASVPPHLVAAPVTPKKNTTTEPLTISLKSELLRKTRILAAARGVNVSKLIAVILADTVRRDLPAVVSALQDSEGDDP